MNSETKKCPFCAEEINVDAIKCKHCGEFLNKPLKNDLKSESLTIRDYSKFALNLPIVLIYIIIGVTVIMWKLKMAAHGEASEADEMGELYIGIFTSLLGAGVWFILYRFMNYLGSVNARKSLIPLIIFEICGSILSLFLYSQESSSVLITMGVIMLLFNISIMIFVGIKFLKIKDETFKIFRKLGHTMIWSPIVGGLLLIVCVIIAISAHDKSISDLGEALSDFIGLIPLAMVLRIFRVAKSNRQKFITE